MRRDIKPVDTQDSQTIPFILLSRQKKYLTELEPD